MKTDVNIKYILIALTVFSSDLICQLPAGVLHRKISKVSNFEFAVYNSGLLYGDYFVFPAPHYTIDGYAPMHTSWPRGSNHIGSDYSRLNGLTVLGKKERYYVSEASSFTGFYGIQRGPFYGMVPGRIGDQNNGFDEVFGGAGWKYNDDRDYIVYSSKDYDTNGVDISGNNYNDWPIRYVNGKEQYVSNHLDRIKYKPVYKSDEDLFTTFKDTETKAKRNFTNIGGENLPMGLEIHLYVYTWGKAALKNVVVYRYEITNKSNIDYDSSYILWGQSIMTTVPPSPSDIFLRALIFHTIKVDYSKNLIYTVPVDSHDYIKLWRATRTPPIIGSSVLVSPHGSDNKALGLTFGASQDRFTYQRFMKQSIYIFNDTVQTDSAYYNRIVHPKIVSDRQFEIGPKENPALLTGSFQFSSHDTVKITYSLIMAHDTNQLFILDDIVKKVYRSNFQLPSPPVSPVVTAKGLNRGVYLEWDKTAESSIDPIIPSDESKPFVGYRVYRAMKESGPYKLLKEWKGDTLAHDYFDKGEDIGGLKNNVTYYYKVTSFDEGDTTIDLESMESEGINGKNLHAVAPTVSSSNITSPNTQANAGAGTLGDIQGITFVPTNVTNYRSFFENRNLQVNLTSITNGVKYLFPVTIKDTVYNRTHNDVIDIGLNVHGTNAIKGIKQGTATVTNIFGLGGANLEIDYSFEQLADSFLVSGTIQSNNGADVPIIINDSLNYTGITEYSPYTSSAKTISVRFTSSGVDTASILFNRRYPYLAVELYDESTGNKIDTRFTFSPFGVRTGTTQVYPGKPNRYYLSGTLSNNETWEFGHILKYYNTRIVFDYADRGVGSGKTGAALYWGSVHKSGTKDFSVGDRVNITWAGGVKANFPKDAVLSISASSSYVSTVTDQIMDKIRIVPNPYLVRHEAQRGNPQIYFNYLPDECTIRIYTIALDLVKTIYHSGGSRIQWDLQTEGGQQVASQMLYAYIESPNGAKTIKKFSVIMGK